MTRGAREIFARFTASKIEHRKLCAGSVAARQQRFTMKITPILCRFALALLFAATMGTAARAQKSTQGKNPSPSTGAPASPLPTPLPAKPVADNLAPARWTRYDFGEPMLFSLIFPAEPSPRVERVQIIPGVVGVSQSYMSVADTGVYGVSYIDALPAAQMNEARRRKVFDEFVKEFAEGFQARMKEQGMTINLTMSEQRATTMGGLAGYEQDFSYGQVMGRVRLVFNAGCAYAVLAIWNGLSAQSERNAFFESLKVNTKR